jgi:hypothetical protein
VLLGESSDSFVRVWWGLSFVIGYWLLVVCCLLIYFSSQAVALQGFDGNSIDRVNTRYI